MRQSQEGRALRQFILSTGKSAGRNSSGRITVFHRGHGMSNFWVRILMVLFLLAVSFWLLWLFDLHFDMVGMLMRAVCNEAFRFLFIRCRWNINLSNVYVFLIFILGLMDNNTIVHMMEAPGSSGGSNSISVGGGSSRGSGWSSFDLGVLAEPFQNEEGEEVAQPNPPSGPANPVAPPGGANEPQALPQAPAPAEVAPPAPNVEEVSALRMELHALITERVREESERGVGPLSAQFPEQKELNSNTASLLMESLEIDSENNPATMREWLTRVREEPNLIKGLITEYLPKKPKWSRK